MGKEPTQTTGWQHVLDFERARLAWVTLDGSHGLWRVAASALTRDGGARHVLSPLVMAGDVYGKDRLPRDPAYTFQLIAGPDRHVILRDYGDTSRDSAEPNRDRFKSIVIDAPESLRRVLTPDEIAAPAAPWPMTGTIRSRDREGREWLLEFPIEHLNHRDGSGGREYQVETGPVLVPATLLDASAGLVSGGFALAYAYFNRPDRVDLAVLQERGSGPMRQRRYAGFARLANVEASLLG